MSAKPRNLRQDESGAAMVEFTAAAFTFMIVLYGVVEFALIFYQFNAATKATQFGARLAAVTDPIASNLLSLTGLEAGALPGATMPSYDCICKFTSGTLGCTGTVPTGASACSAANVSGTKAGANAMNIIAYGRDSSGTPNTACVDTNTTLLNQGMCNMYKGLTASNIVVEYKYTGLGYAGRPGGPVPTITVSLQGLTYNFILVGGLARINSFQFPAFATTVTGEDLSGAGS